LTSARSRYAGFSLDRAREVVVRAREGRLGELLERLARAVAARAGEHGATALAGGQGDLEGVVLAGEEHERAPVQLAFLVPRPRLP
jgi:hypothetical protein